ncbi:hypothetical protein AB4K20DRAFT_1905170 [Rhizopus microsporus]
MTSLSHRWLMAIFCLGTKGHSHTAKHIMRDSHQGPCSFVYVCVWNLPFYNLIQHIMKKKAYLSLFTCLIYCMLAVVKFSPQLLLSHTYTNTHT